MLEIWKGGEVDIRIAPSKLHGDVYADDQIGTVAWSPDERHIAFVAEAFVPKSTSCVSYEGADPDLLTRLGRNARASVLISSARYASVGECVRAHACECVRASACVRVRASVCLQCFRVCVSACRAVEFVRRTRTRSKELHALTHTQTHRSCTHSTVLLLVACASACRAFECVRIRAVP